MRYALIRGGTVATIVEQGSAPAIEGTWIPIGGQAAATGWLYDSGSGLFSEPPAIVYKLITTEAFWDRFTNAEIVAYDVAEQHDVAATNNAKKAAAKLRIFRRDAGDFGYRKLGNQKIIDFVTGLETTPDTMSGTVIAPGRAAEILAPITADEAFIKP